MKTNAFSRLRTVTASLLLVVMAGIAPRADAQAPAAATMGAAPAPGTSAPRSGPGATRDAALAASTTATTPPAPLAVAVPHAVVPPAAPTRAADGSAVFGSQIFGGRFAGQSFTGFNPDYQIAPGDRINVRLWGAYALETTQVVDAQGNIFLPSVGPVKLVGARNAELNAHVQASVKRVFRANVYSYASLEAAQPVKIYVTGFVRQPGLYNGLSSDSALHYLDAAGGIDPDRGSYLDVQVLRSGAVRARIDLYRFLLEGKIDPLQLHDGDTLLVAPRRYAVRVTGDVDNAAMFELREPAATADHLLALARPKPTATHLAVVRLQGAQRRSEYHPIAEATKISIASGDEVTVMADKVPGTILVRIDGAHRGQRTAVLPYGARLKDAVALLQPSPQARVDALQLYRRSIAVRQKEMLGVSLEKLQMQVLTARSATNEEASLRAKEAELVLQFAERARGIEPKGQFVLPEPGLAGDALLEDGDLIVVPEESAQVSLHGEVMFPGTLHHGGARTVSDYIELAGGYTQNADTSRVLLIRRSGAVVEADRGAVPQAGEELMVLPKAATKSIEVTRGITQIIYQIAVAARIALGL